MKPRPSVGADVRRRTAAARYQQRLARYTAALRNEQPDRVPLRPFVAEFTGVHAGYTCQQMAHQYPLAFEAACRCATDFDWDAVVPKNTGFILLPLW